MTRNRQILGKRAVETNSADMTDHVDPMVEVAQARARTEAERKDFGRGLTAQFSQKNMGFRSSCHFLSRSSVRTSHLSTYHTCGLHPEHSVNCPHCRVP